MMKGVQRLTCAGLLLASVTVLGADATTPGQFAIRLPIVTSQRDGVHALALTEQVYLSSSSRELADLRIFNAKGEALPWVKLPTAAVEAKLGDQIELTLVPLPAETDSRSTLLQSLAVRVERDAQRAVVEVGPAAPQPLPAGAIGGYLIDARRLKDRSGQLQLSFAPDAPDFAGRIDILGSDDLVVWRLVKSGSLTLNRKLGEPVEHRAFDIAQPAAFLRLHWVGSDGPDLAGARFSDRSIVAPPLPRTPLKLVPDPDRSGSFLIELPTAMPVERLHFRPQTMNESFRVEVSEWTGHDRRRRHLLTRARADQWTSIGQVDVTRVMRGGAEVVGEPLRYSSAGGLLRLTPVEIPRVDAPLVEAEWRPARIVFVARAPGPYFLAVGNPDAKRDSTLELRSVLSANDRNGQALPVAHLSYGSADAMASSAEQRQRREHINAHAQWSQAMLWTVLLVAVSALAWMAWKLSLQLRQTSDRERATDPRSGKGDSSV